MRERDRGGRGFLRQRGIQKGGDNDGLEPGVGVKPVGLSGGGKQWCGSRCGGWTMTLTVGLDWAWVGQLVEALNQFLHQCIE